MTDFNYTLKISPRRKTIGIRVSPDNSITVYAPMKINESRITEIVKSKSSWIQKRIAINEIRNSRLKPKEYRDGEEFLYRGEIYHLNIFHGTEGISFSDGLLKIGVPFGLDGKERNYIFHKMKYWYAFQAEKIFRERVIFYQGILGVKVKLVRIKTLRSRWGSCSSKGNISFNWLLVMAPHAVIDYIVVHELCHCIHHNHSRSYWKLVESILPDYKKWNTWLRLNSFTLAL